MRFDELGNCCIAEKETDFEGWTILAIEDWKPGVKRVHAHGFVNGKPRFAKIYADEKLTKNLKYDLHYAKTI